MKVIIRRMKYMLKNLGNIFICKYCTRLDPDTVLFCIRQDKDPPNWFKKMGMDGTSG